VKIAVAIAVVLVLAACGGGSKQTHADTLTDLQSVAQLKTLFNAHAGEPRLILLISPT
jgi:ABC-type glycerol-3-phosphate transport system substrate-binding protein